MSKFAIPVQRAAASASVACAAFWEATTLRRAKLYEFEVGSSSTPADVGILFEFQRSTTAPSGGTAITPQVLDPADSAAVGLNGMSGTITSDGTLTSNAIMKRFALNQRSTYRWIAAPGCEIFVPASATNGLHMRTPTLNGGTPQIDGVLYVEEQ